MYNSIITGADGAWDVRQYELPRDRFCEFTSPKLKERFFDLGPSAIAELMAMPTLFAYEGDEEDVRVGYLTKISDRERNVYIEFEFDERIPPIPFEKIDPLLGRLSLNGQWEWTRTHWAIKNEDLLGVLAGAGLVDDVGVGEVPRAGLPPRQTWQLLGQGGFGSVYRVADPRLGLDFAVKVFDPSPFNTNTEDARARFLREAGLLFQLHHDHVIRIYDAAELASGQPFIKMEYFPGKDLQRFSDERPFTPADTIAIVRRLASALGHAHDRTIIHRDLKPSNVLVSDALDDLRLIDFGLGIVIEKVIEQARLTRSSAPFAGAFSSPELLQNPKSTDPANDMYSVGAIWFWMLTGRVPFGLGIESALTKLDLPAKAKQSLRGCLAHDGTDRPSARELADALEPRVDAARAKRTPAKASAERPANSYLSAESDIRTVLGVPRSWTVDEQWLQWARQQLAAPRVPDGQPLRVTGLVAMWLATHKREWINQDDLAPMARTVFQLMEDVAPDRLKDSIARACDDATEYGWLVSEEYDTWEPGMRSGSGMRNRYKLAPGGRKALNDAGYQEMPIYATVTRPSGL